MAIPTFVSAGTSAASTGDTATPGAPSSSVDGDVWLLHTAGKAGAVHPTNLHQWVPVIQWMEPNQDLLVMAVWAHVYDGVTAPNLEVTDGGGTTSVLMAACSAWRGCGTPAWHKVAASDDNTNDANVSCDSVTTADADCMIVAFVAVSDNPTIGSWTNSNLASPGITEAYEELTTLSTDMHISCAYGGLATAGASGATTATLQGAVNSKVFVTLALTPTADITHPYLTGVDFDDQNDATITLTALADAEDDDVWLLFLNARNDEEEPAPPTGGDWTQIGALEEGSSSFSAAYYHRYDTSAPNLVVPNPATNHSAILMGFRQCVDAGTPVDASGAGTSAGDTWSITGVTPTEDNCAIAWAVFCQHNDKWLGNFANATIGIHGGVAGRASADENEGYGLAYSIEDTAGASGAATGIVDGSANTIHWAIALEPAVAATFTGTSAATTGSVTSSASGTFTAPTYTGTSAATVGAVTSASSGAFTGPTYTGTSTITAGVAISAASGTFTAPVYTGTSTITVAATTASASGTFTAPVYTATSAATATAATAAGSGTFSVGVVTGTAAATSGTVIAAASGTFTAPVYTATSTATTPAATLAGTGTHVAPTSTGTMAAMVAAATSAASGTFSPPVYSGTSSVVIGSATAAASGTHTAPTFSGTAAVSVGPATLSATGTFTEESVFSGTAAITTASVTAAASGQYTSASVATSAIVTPAATLAASGQFTAPVYSGSATAVVGTVLASGSATFTTQTFSGTAGITVVAAQAAASGTFAVPVYTGVGTITVGVPVMVATGTQGTFTSVTCWWCRHRTIITGTGNCYRCQSRLTA